MPSSIVAVLVVLMAQPSSDEAAIRAARVAQNKAIAAGELDTVAALWTEDITVRRALGHSLDGRAAARQALEPAAGATTRLVYQRQTQIVEVSAKWPLAFETGTWSGHLEKVTGPVVIGGRFSAQWVRRDGKWLIRSEVFVALSCAGVGCDAAALP